MSYDYVIDSYAWIEYFRGSEEGKITKEFIENKTCATCSITIAELSEKYSREKKEFAMDLHFIISKNKIVNLDKDIAGLAGQINFENKKKIKNWGMADSIILATSNLLNAKVVTGNEHFRNLGAIMLKQ